MFTTLNSLTTDRLPVHLYFFFLTFFQKIEFDIPCDSSPGYAMEMIRMKCKVLFSGKNMKKSNCNVMCADLLLNLVKASYLLEVSIIFMLSEYLLINLNKIRS